MMEGLSATEVGRVAADALAEIAEKSVGGAPIYQFIDDCPVSWTTIADGGWDSVGVSETDGGGEASLRDLVEIAKAWGKTSIPLPLLETIWVKRWSAAARELQGPLSVAVRRSQSGNSECIAPFGALSGISIARSIGGNDEFVTGPVGAPETFAPSLLTTIVDVATTIPAGAASELAVIWAAESVGAAQQLLQLSVEYAKTREQFGNPIGSFQAIKHRLADMHSDAEYAETAVIWASVEADQAKRASLYAVDTSIRVAESAIQVHGGMGFTWEMGLHFYLRAMLTQRELINGLWAHSTV